MALGENNKVKKKKKKEERETREKGWKNIYVYW